MRADYLEPRHLERMRGRVTTVSVSAESGSQRVVTEVVRKRLDLAAIVRAAENAHKAGVSLLIHYMIGLPGETAEEINETLEFELAKLEPKHLYEARFAVEFTHQKVALVEHEGRGLELANGHVPVRVLDRATLRQR